MNIEVTAIKKRDDDKQSSEMLAEYIEPLLVFLDDDILNEICVNRPREVWTEGSGGWKRHEAPALNHQHCRQLAILIANCNGKSISKGKPVLSAALPGGERVQVIILPACEPHTVSIKIRKPSLADKTLDELEDEGAFDEVLIVDVKGDLLPHENELMKFRNAKKIKEFLNTAMKHGLKLINVGKTDSGKTTISKSITNCIPKHERLVMVEDVHEIFLNEHPNKLYFLFTG